MKQHVFFRNLLLSLYALVIFFQAYASEGSWANRLGMAAIIAISSVYFVKCLFLKYKNLFFNSWTALLCLNVVSFIFTATYLDEQHYQMFAGILITSLSFYPFYYFVMRGCFGRRELRTFLLIMIPIYIYRFYSLESIILMEQSEVINNVSYAFVALMPVIFLIRKKTYATGIAMLLMAFIIQSAKRGAMIAGGLVLLVYFCYMIRNTAGKNNPFRLLGVLLLIAFLAYFGYNYYLSNDFAVRRMSDMEGGSGRDLIFIAILSYWYRYGDLWEYLFGFGFSASLEMTHGFYAHNDWLELLSSVGLIGFFTYFVLYFSSIKIFKTYNWAFAEKYMLLSVLLVWLLTSMVSMWYTNIQQGYLYSIFLAYLLAGSLKGKQLNAKLLSENRPIT